MRKRKSSDVDKTTKQHDTSWQKDWHPGTYFYLDPDYVPGTHPAERGEVTWHYVPPPPRQSSTGKGSRKS
jgi:hypothetical protein